MTYIRIYTYDTIGGVIPENNEILVNIVNWEKDLRLDITEGLWKRTPSELAGKGVLSVGQNYDLFLSLSVFDM